MKLELRKEDLHLQNGSLLRNLRVLGLPSKNLRAWSLPINIQSQNECLMAFPSISLFIQQLPNT
jgi:hypothetical protein